MSVKLNIKAKSLDDLGLELRTKRKPRKSRYVNTNIQNIQNLRTPYNLNSFGIRGIPTETINQNNIPTIYSSIALENLKALENLNQNNKLKLLKNDDNNDIKEYINTGLNNVIAGGKSLGNNLYNEIMKNRQMIDNFNTKKTFIPSGNSTSAGVTLDGRAGVLPDNNTNDEFFKHLENLSNFDNSTPIKENEQNVNDDEEEIVITPRPLNKKAKFYKKLFMSNGQPKNIAGYNKRTLLDDFYKTYPDKNIVMENGLIVLRDKKENEINNTKFTGIGQGNFKIIRSKIQNFVKDNYNPI